MKFHFAPSGVYPRYTDSSNYEERGWTICGWINDYYFRQLINALNGKPYNK